MDCFFKQKTAYEMRISDWSSDVCSSDLACRAGRAPWPRDRRARPAGRRPCLSAPGPAPRGSRAASRRMASSRPLVAAGLVKEAVAPVPVGQRLLGVFRIAVGALGLGRQLHPGWFGFQHDVDALRRSEEHTSELQSLMRISSAVFCLKKKKNIQTH